MDELLIRKLSQRLSLSARPALIEDIASFLRVSLPEAQEACRELASRGLVILADDVVTPVPWWDLDHLELFLNVPRLPEGTFSEYTGDIDSLSHRLRSLGFPVLRPQTNETLMTIILGTGSLVAIAGVGLAVAAFIDYVVKSQLSSCIELKAIRRSPDGSEVLVSVSATRAEEVIGVFDSVVDTLEASPSKLATSDVRREAANPIIFISYRRADTEGITGRIYDHLISCFGASHVFMDVESILPGLDFRQVLSLAVARCDVLLAVIGGDWLTVEQDGVRRLNDPEDYVRVEIETALGRGIPVVPVLIGSTSVLGERELPESLRPLAQRNAVRVHPGAEFHVQMSVLCENLQTLYQATDAQPREVRTERPWSSPNSAPAADGWRRR